VKAATLGPTLDNLALWQWTTANLTLVLVLRLPLGQGQIAPLLFKGDN
jgi:hypothetical protein